MLNVFVFGILIIFSIFKIDFLRHNNVIILSTEKIQYHHTTYIT